MNALNILFVSGTDPNRNQCGGDVRTRALLEALNAVGRVCVASFDASTHEVPGKCAVVVREPLGLVRTWINRVVWAFCEWVEPSCPKIMPFPWDVSFERTFPGLCFDLIVVRYPHLAAITHFWRYGRVFVDIDDCPLQRYETMSADRHGRLRRALTRWFIRRQMSRLLEHCEGGWVSNPDDVAKFKAKFNVRALINIPRPVPSNYDFAMLRAPMLLTVGALGRKSPNVVGIERFLATVWPRVRDVWPDLEYWIAGGGLPDDVRSCWERIPGVRCLGFVDEIDGLYARTIATVVPIETGGGSCVKTREALVHGRSCLTTEFGARGIAAEDLKDGKCGLLVYHGADEFISSLKRLMDESLRQKVECSALLYAGRHLTQDRFTRQVRELITN